jgi:hypothetical protein
MTKKLMLSKGSMSRLVLPADVDGMVDVKLEAFAAIEEAEAKDVVVEEGEHGVQNCVDEVSDRVVADLAAAKHQRDAGVGVATHVFLVERQSGILEVEEVAAQVSHGAGRFRGGVWFGVLFEAGKALTEEAQLAVGVDSAMPHPATEDEIEARDGIAVELEARWRGDDSMFAASSGVRTSSASRFRIPVPGG